MSVCANPEKADIITTAELQAAIGGRRNNQRISIAPIK